MKKHFWVVIIIFSVFSTKCKNDKNTEIPENVVFCGAENLTEDGKKFRFRNVEFTGGINVSDEEYYEGSHSMKLTKESSSGMGMVFHDLQPNEFFEIQVYRKSKEGKGGPVAKAKNSNFYIEQFSSIGKKDENGWELLLLRFKLPYNVEEMGGLKFFIWAQDGEEPVYFDNLKIKRYLNQPETSFGDIETIKIKLTTADYTSICKARDIALKNNQITKDLKKKYRGFLSYGDESLAIEIRLKGDWADHLVGNKWSYRISIRDGKTFLGMKSFSIQDPNTRVFLHEWIFHELLKQEDVLTTRFNFLPVSVNGSNYGIYAVEEHFDKRLIESNNRREGVIVKFNEEGLWEQRSTDKYWDSHVNNSDLAFESAEIIPFKQKKTKNTPVLAGQFSIAQNLLDKHKAGKNSVDEYLDIDKLARAYALMNIGNVDHSLIWHNQRFYYNPVIAKLELIVFDCYPFIEYVRKGYPLIFGLKAEKDKLIVKDSYNFLNPLNNAEFLEKYLFYLKKYTDGEFIKGFVESKTIEIDSLSDLISADYLSYDYDKAYLIKNAKIINGQVAEYEEKINKGELSFKLKEPSFEIKCTPHHPLKNIALSAHVDSETQNSKRLDLVNYHCQPLLIKGYSIKANKDSIIALKLPVQVNNFNTSPKKNVVRFPKDVIRLFYGVVGLDSDSLYKSSISSWKRPVTESKLDLLLNKVENNTKAYIEKEGKYLFKKGKQVIKEGIVIPKGFEVEFEAGAELDFINGSFFMSWSPVQMKGNETATIKVTSSDGTGNGFTVLQAGKKSTLNYVEFNGLNTFKKEGWTLTGAVNFYESEVEISNCLFTNNHCEDGLNIIRTNFKLINSTVSNTFSDGFDADFCTGEVIGSTFENTGNDCLDFSGSTIKIKDCSIKNSGDKGVSCGEQSTVSIENVTINIAVLGVASKDKSKVTVNKITLTDCQTGFAAFQKKPEYGPATITATGVKSERVVLLKDEEIGSVIIIN